MSVDELRSKFLTQFTVLTLQKRGYIFKTRSGPSRIRNKKCIQLTSTVSLNELADSKICCVDKCLTYFSKEQLLSERIKYPFSIVLFSTISYFELIFCSA